jgi:hypothetical protein
VARLRCNRQLVPLHFSKLRNMDRVDPLYVHNCRQAQPLRPARRAARARACSRDICASTSRRVRVRDARDRVPAVWRGCGMRA